MIITDIIINFVLSIIGWYIGEWISYKMFGHTIGQEINKIIYKDKN